MKEAFSCVEAFLLKSPREGAQTSVYCGISKDLHGVGGKYFKDCKSLKATAHAYDREISKTLYDKTLQLIT